MHCLQINLSQISCTSYLYIFNNDLIMIIIITNGLKYYFKESNYIKRECDFNYSTIKIDYKKNNIVNARRKELFYINSNLRH